MATLSANGRKLEMSSYTLNNASILEVFCGRDTPPNSVSGGLVSIMSCKQVCANDFIYCIWFLSVDDKTR